MYIANLFENYITEAGTQLVVLFPGRFQPFHLGHREVFASLQAKFGRDNVWISTSNKTELPKSPFDFNDKMSLMTAAGVSVDRILESSSPYKLPPQFNPENTIFIVAVGEPDADRLRPDTFKKDGNPSYYKSFKGLEDAVTADKHGYVIIANERKKIISIGGEKIDVSHGTQSREVWNMVRKDPKKRAEYMLQMYGRNDSELGRILDKIPQDINEEADPELSKTIDFAVGHYPNIKDRGEAFMKFVQRSLKHGLETDIDQQKKINDLTRDIEQLKKQIADAKLTNEDVPTPMNSRTPQTAGKSETYKKDSERYNKHGAAAELLDEIGYSDKLGDLSVPDSKIISSATEDGVISQTPVMKYEQGNTTLFFFADAHKISALVLVVDGNKLRAIKNFSGQSGQVYALMNYIVNIKNTRLIITPDEPLTKEGFAWVARLIKNPSGLKVLDLDGNSIDIGGLRNEWLKSKSSHGTESGKTGIVISESSRKWKNTLQENETRLIPHIYFNVTPNTKQNMMENTDVYTVIANGKEFPCQDESHAENKARKILSYKQADIVYVTKNGKKIYSWKLGEKKQPISEEAAGGMGKDNGIPNQNSLGRPITTSPESLKNFWNWFRGSEVVDSRGRPLVVFHGTPMTFSKFGTFPAFFTDNPTAAGGYAKSQYAPPEVDSGPNTMPVYLRLKNPKILNQRDLWELIGNGDDESDIEWSDFDNVAHHFAKQGHDGLILHEIADFGGVYNQYVAFNDRQIKSAIGNRGAYSDQPEIVSEEAAGVGVVKNSKDPRYSMATMGDQNDVDGDTLGKSMAAFGLVGRKPPKTSQKQVNKNIGKGVKEGVMSDRKIAQTVGTVAGGTLLGLPGMYVGGKLGKMVDKGIDRGVDYATKKVKSYQEKKKELQAKQQKLSEELQLVRSQLKARKQNKQ